MNPGGSEEEELFDTIGSRDFLGFQFKTLYYGAQLAEAQLKTRQLCGLTVSQRRYGDVEAVRCRLSFAFMGGSLGCAEGHKLQLAAQHCMDRRLPLIVDAQSGGVRMQEGVLALMQMMATNQAIARLRQEGVLTVSIFRDPCFGGTSASFMFATDVQIAFGGARVGFAGPSVITNTIFDGDSNRFDRQVPRGFQTSDRMADNGFCHLVVDSDEQLDRTVGHLLALVANKERAVQPETDTAQAIQEAEFSYKECRGPAHPKPADYVGRLFQHELRFHSDGALQISLCTFAGQTVFVYYNTHDSSSALAGLGTPTGYRQAAYFSKIATKFNIPIITLVDTAGALPSPEAEDQCQAQAISECITAFSQCGAVILTVILGEGGSGGAIALSGANFVAAMQKSFYNVISPEGGVSILQNSVYKQSEDAKKKKEFNTNCELLAKAQKCYSFDVYRLGVVDCVIKQETDMDRTCANIKSTLLKQLCNFQGMTQEEIRQQRYERFQGLVQYNTFGSVEEGLQAAHQVIIESPKIIRERKQVNLVSQDIQRTLQFIGERTINRPSSIQVVKVNTKQEMETMQPRQGVRTIKQILKQKGPAAVREYLISHPGYFITDTSARDAHQSQAATRYRTKELQQALSLLEKSGLPYVDKLFSVECWGGATFDTCLRFLQEDPWERLQQLAKTVPNTLTQMLLRGSNAVGYTRYADNVVQEFVVRAAENGMDVFRVFDAFNNLSQIQLCCDTVLQRTGKLLEVCICFTGNFLEETEHVYTLEYYRNLAQQIYERWPGLHLICIKDMAGLLTPQMAEPLVQTIREATHDKVPLHFHTHDTSGGQIATLMAMIQAGVKIVDVASASVSGLTSQPCMQTLFKFTGCCQDQVLANNLLKYDTFWHQMRSIYAQAYEFNISAVRAPSSDVYIHQIPGGQISNLHQQCIQMGLGDKFEQLKINYRQVNQMLGNIIKVTPSSKIVGDIALFMLQNNFTIDQVQDPMQMRSISFPESIKDFVKGGLGIPHVGMNKLFVQSVLQLSNSELDSFMKTLQHSRQQLPDVDFEEVQQKMMQLRPYGNQILDSISYCLYEKVFTEFCKNEQQNSQLIPQIPVFNYLFGMTINEEIQIIDNVNGNEVVNVQLIRIKNKNYNGDQELLFKVNGQIAKVQIKHKEEKKIVYEFADANLQQHHGSLVLGIIDQIGVKQNEFVKKGQFLMKICSAKLEVRVCAKLDGKVKVVMKEGDKVIPGCLVAVVE